jgi:hypothetical protein
MTGISGVEGGDFPAFAIQYLPGSKRREFKE